MSSAEASQIILVAAIFFTVLGVGPLFAVWFGKFTSANWDTFVCLAIAYLLWLWWIVR
jgi:hypothetical protein